MKALLFLVQIKNFFVNILFPIKCVGCRTKNEILCSKCLSQMPSAEEIVDPNIIALFNYQDKLVKKIIWELKYHHKRYLGQKLGQLLFEFFIEDLTELKMTLAGQLIIVIPVPISQTKIRSRGYNQSLSIAKGFVNSQKNIFILQNKNIYKKVNNPSQAKIHNRKIRLKNTEGVFGLKNPKIIKGKTIIIIDDVTTTGGTINEIIKILKKAGAKKIIGLAIAH